LCAHFNITEVKAQTQFANLAMQTQKGSAHLCFYGECVRVRHVRVNENHLLIPQTISCSAAELQDKTIKALKKSRGSIIMMLL
jgi:hypothetical protein